MDIYEVFGTLSFPSKKDIDAWMRDSIDDASRAVFVKIVRPPGGRAGEMPARTVAGMFEGWNTGEVDKVVVVRRSANVDISMLFDDSVLVDHGSALLGALAVSRSHGAEGTLHMLAGMWLMNDLVIEKGKAKLVKPKKRTRSVDVPGEKEHRKRLA